MSEVNGALSPFGIKTIGFTVQDLPPQAQHLLRAQGQRRRYRRDEEVVRRGTVPTHAFWLLSGRLRSVSIQADGSEMHGGWIMPQEIFGLHLLILNASAKMSLWVDTPECEVVHFPLDVLREMVMTRPDVGLGVAVGLSRRLSQVFDIYDVVGPRNLAGKLRRVLQWWARQYGIAARDGSVELWVGQGELATGVGASRQRVHEELKRLRESGDLELGYRKVILYPRFFQATEATSEPSERTNDL